MERWRESGDRIEALLDACSVAGPAARDRAEDLVREVLDLYGAGLTRILDAIAVYPGAVDAVARDDLVASLLLVHGLHPHDVTTRVRTALDGHAGLRLAQEFAPDIVLLDLAMPGMDGYEVMRHLREPQRALPKVIALTGFGAETERDRIQQAGFDAHLVKPVESRKILDLIASLEL